MFYDYVKIYVKGGDGGHGSNAMRREKYIPFGGPAGGDGGRGGDVVFYGDDSMNTLIDFKFKQHYKADRGVNGLGKTMHGKNAEDLRVPVPLGTIIKDDETGEILGEILELGQELIVAKAGRGGRGNCRFATQKNPAPDIYEKGEPGEEHWLRLELKLIADVALVGMPSAGKSSIISKVSGSRPKIADYPFTTLVPNLGVVKLDYGKSFVLADIPGLIEGAAEGAGLGHRFLRHVERTKILIHVLDMSEPFEREPWTDFEMVNKELLKYREDLSYRKQIIAANKMDTEGAEERLAELKKRLGDEYEIFPVSTLTGEGLNELMWRAYNLLGEIPIQQAIEVPETKITKVVSEKEFEVIRDYDGAFRVTGEKIEKFIVMTDWDSEESVRRMQNIFIKMGVEDELRKKGAKDGDTVRMGDVEFEFAY